MSPIRSRPCSGLDDLELVLEFVRSAAAARWPGASYLHPGDFAWRTSAETAPDPRESLRLWIEGDRLAGFAWLDEAQHFELDARPDLDRDRALDDEMLDWVEGRARAAGFESLTTAALRADRARRAVLARRGYRPEERGGAPRFRHGLSEIGEQPLRGGLRVRDVVGADLEERVAAHRDAWERLEHIGIPGAASSFSSEAYRRLRESPLYDPELDLVVETPDGRFASCCIAWLDAPSGVGAFEPVGTRATYRRRGAARAMILEALRRLRARGARVVHVGTASFNEPAIALYRSCGFDVVDLEDGFVKRLSGPSRGGTPPAATRGGRG